MLDQPRPSVEPWMNPMSAPPRGCLWRCRLTSSVTISPRCTTYGCVCPETRIIMRDESCDTTLPTIDSNPLFGAWMRTREPVAAGNCPRAITGIATSTAVSLSTRDLTLSIGLEEPWARSGDGSTADSSGDLRRALHLHEVPAAGRGSRPPTAVHIRRR